MFYEYKDSLKRNAIELGDHSILSLFGKLKQNMNYVNYSCE